MTIAWKQIADAWNDEFDSEIPEISSMDLHALALAFVGEPSPHDWSRYENVYQYGDSKVAARWALRKLASA